MEGTMNRIIRNANIGGIRKVVHKGKKLLYYLPLENIHDKSILFIIGCQRSGTTLLTEIFDRDWKTKVFGEFSSISDYLRLKPLNEVKRIIGEQKAPLIIAKPLVETQNITELLDYFPNAKALWVFRNYKAVTLSDLRLFGIDNGIKNLTPIADNDVRDWRAEKVSPAVKKIVHKYYAPDMNVRDAGALFWYARNALFFEQRLDANPNIKMLKYEDFVHEPSRFMAGIYKWIGGEFPGDQIVDKAHSRSVFKGSSIELSPEIIKLCDSMLSNLEQAYRSKGVMAYPPI